ncbi:histidine phosphatase family protein [Falsibacillus albus]|uniref:Histidine phosphatase family protein n=1 Tax=Falsibacillus albus TaxID=2478915 RepID=A0A3L7JK74_9BACI|nr:histidine phosphatase family protein [Falsibacillus albus]RLQ91133.1 histidine phosphatase family protein [Falsibacillus albus]
MKKNIYLVRHAKAEGQEFSASLTELGRRQAQGLISFFQNKKIDRIVSSPFLRAMETIRPLAESIDLNIEEDVRLSERVLSQEDFPDWKDKLRESFDDFSLAFPGGESSQAGFDRAKSLIEEIRKSPYENIILVSHGNLSTLLLRQFDEQYGYEHLMNLTNPDVYHIRMDGDSVHIWRIWE